MKLYYFRAICNVLQMAAKFFVKTYGAGNLESWIPAHEIGSKGCFDGLVKTHRGIKAVSRATIHVDVPATT